jgi:PKD repeat protein
MYKKILATLSLAITGMLTYAQTEVNHVCGTDLLFQQKVAHNPALQQEYENLLKTAAVTQPNVEKAVRIIPVVFHIIHNGGDENISKAQIEDQIRILNEDYRRLNADAANTPSVWQSIGADANIEFRLANIDPSGNCTDGIVRIKSSLTNDASDDTGVKALSYWPRNKYLNIWVVKTIDNMGAAGIVLGYAQLPIQFFTANTDGVVLRHDVVGSIGTALTGVDPQGKGRTATHEVGHWLGLRHIWGDSDCGDDFVNDTPVHQTANSGCPAFPKTNTCSGAGANGEMFMNYMDYTRGSCQNMFSAGQKAVFDITLTSISFRASVIAQSNLTATGVLNNPPNTCAPKADFTTSDVFICSGNQIEFTDASWNGTPTQWNWQFTGGTPATSTEQNPTVTYNTPGIYDVTLTVTNSNGNNTTTKQAVVQVFSNVAEQQSVWNYTEPFEDQGYFDNSWFVVNSDGDNYKWQRASNAGLSQTGAAKMNNFGNGNADNRSTLTLLPIRLLNLM